jgi:hypothetical protein
MSDVHGFRNREILLALHFFAFSIIPDRLHHSLILSISFCRQNMSADVCILRYNTVSSANNRMELEICCVMSFRKIRNSKGPKTLPCGTPDKASSGCEVAPSTKTVLPISNDLIINDLIISFVGKFKVSAYCRFQINQHVSLLAKNLRSEPLNAHRCK